MASDNGHIVLYAHLLHGTIPRDFCPAGHASRDAQFMINADDKRPDGLPREAVIPAARRRRVETGDFLGRIGHSGASSGRHLHIHRKPFVEGSKERDSIPLPYRRGWMQHKPGGNPFHRPAAWQRLEGDELNAGDVIWPSPLVRFRSATDGPTRGSVTIEDLGRHVVTACRDNDNRLRLRVWEISGDHLQWKPLGTAVAGQVSEIAIVTLPFLGVHAAAPHPPKETSGGFVTAVRNELNNLQLIAWDLHDDGTITRGPSVTRGTAGSIAIARLALAHTDRGQTAFLTALRDGQGALRLNTWTFDADRGFRQRAVALGPEIHAVDAVMASNFMFAGVVTAARNRAGRLRLDSWNVARDVTEITHADSRVDKPLDLVRVNHIDDTDLRRFATVGRNPEGDLEVMFWSVGGGGSDGTDPGQLTLLGSLIAGHVEDVAISSVHGLKGIVTAMRDSDERLRIVPVELGSTPRRISGVAGGTARSVALTRSNITFDRGGQRRMDLLYTALRDDNGRLRVMSWDTNF